MIDPKWPRKTFQQQVEALEQDLIEKAIVDWRGNVAKAAFALGINRTTLFMKMKKYNTEAHLEKCSYLIK